MKKIKKKTLIKLIAAAAAFLSLLGVCIYTVFIRPALMNRETVIYMEEQVQSGDLVQGIMENGSVEMAVSSVTYDLDISYDEEEEDEDDEEDDEETSRYLEIEEVYVVQGQRVEEGDALFKFTQDSIDGVRRNLENSVSEARVDLAEADSEYNTQAQTARSTYNSSVAESDTAQRTYDATMSGLQQEINLLYADIQVLQAEIDDWTDEGKVADYLRALLHKQAFDKAGLIYGMGHAVYSISDPRANIFKSFVHNLAKEKGMEKEYGLYSLVETLAPKVIAEERRIYKGVSANIDFYSGFVYHMLGLPTELFTPVFAMARIAGWSAHLLEEQINVGKIIRPAYKSISEVRDYVSMDER